MSCREALRPAHGQAPRRPRRKGSESVGRFGAERSRKGERSSPHQHPHSERAPPHSSPSPRPNSGRSTPRRPPRRGSRRSRRWLSGCVT
jgi:hypothetical protein